MLQPEPEIGQEKCVEAEFLSEPGIAWTHGGQMSFYEFGRGHDQDSGLRS